MATLETKHLKTHFDGVKAVDDVNLAVSDGEFLVLLGSSGSGKSTLMRTIAGLEDATSGDVIIGGRRVNELTPNARNIAMVFQSYALYPHKTVFKNIAFPLEAVRTSRDEIRRRVGWSADLLGIGHLVDRKPRALSGGEQQRVALARALVREPNLFLLDEPLSNLDAKLRHLARHELKRLHGRTGTTTIYVTHDQVEAMGLGERVAVMNHGKIEQIGAPSDIYRKPANVFVARFMGSPAMNLIHESGTLIGFHPENFLPAGHFPTSDDALHLPFHVSGAEDLGSDILLYGFIGDAPEKAADEVIAKLPASLAGAVEIGRQHDFFVRREMINRFDPEDGHRLGERAA